MKNHFGNILKYTILSSAFSIIQLQGNQNFVKLITSNMKTDVHTMEVLILIYNFRELDYSAQLILGLVEDFLELLPD